MYVNERLNTLLVEELQHSVGQGDEEQGEVFLQ